MSVQGEAVTRVTGTTARRSERVEVDRDELDDLHRSYELAAAEIELRNVEAAQMRAELDQQAAGLRELRSNVGKLTSTLIVTLNLVGADMAPEDWRRRATLASAEAGLSNVARRVGSSIEADAPKCATVP